MADQDLVSVITADHREVEKVFKELESKEGTPEHRRNLADHLITELVRHSVAEEQYMYPAARDALDDGDQIADHEIEEHNEVEKLLNKLEKAEATDPEFDELLTKIIGNVRHHIEDEEGELLPKLQSACTPDQLEDLGQKVLDAKEKAPTHPHPASPSTPPANKILGPGAALVDRMRDALSRS